MDLGRKRNMGRKIAFLGLLTSLAVIFGYIDTLIPVFSGVPGVKLGLANLAVIIVLYQYGWKEAGIVSLARIFIVGFLFGSLFGIFYSLSGAIFSLIAMTFLKNRAGFSMVGVSIIGGVFHNIGQLLTAMVVVENLNLGYYFSILLISGILTGLCIGEAAWEVWKRIERKIE